MHLIIFIVALSIREICIFHIYFFTFNLNFFYLFLFFKWLFFFYFDIILNFYEMFIYNVFRWEKLLKKYTKHCTFVSQENINKLHIWINIYIDLSFMIFFLFPLINKQTIPMQISLHFTHCAKIMHN